MFPMKRQTVNILGSAEFSHCDSDSHWGVCPQTTPSFTPFPWLTKCHPLDFFIVIENNSLGPVPDTNKW